MHTVSKTVFLLLIILSFTFLAYLPSLKAGFTNWDDDYHLVANPDIRQLDAEHVERMFNSRIARTYIPLSLLSYSIEYQFFKLNPFIYHLNNVLLHLGVVVLVFFLAQRFGLTPTASAWAALIFGIHPMHVESVAWISERKDVLCAVFYLSALLVYWKYLDQGKFRWGWLTASILFGLLSMLSKPMAYSLPAVLFIIDWWQRRKLSLGMIGDKIPHVLYVLILSWMTLSINKTQLAFDIYQVPLIWIQSLVFYIYKFFVPLNYIAIYKIPEPVGFFNPSYVAALVVFLTFLIVLVYCRRHRLLMMACSFYFLSISMIVVRSVWDFGNNTVLADRFMYIPSIGFCILLGFGINFSQKYFESSVLKKNILNILMICLVFFLFVKTFQQCFVWKNTVSLWNHQIKFNPSVSRAYVNRAQGYIENKQFNLALKDLDISETADAEGLKNERLYVARGLVYFMQNNIELALKNFNQALELNPYNLDALVNRGNVWGRKQEYDKALKDFYDVLLIRRESPKAYYGLAAVYQALGDFDKAIPLYQEALQLNPNDIQIKNSYEMLLDKLNHDGEKNP